MSSLDTLDELLKRLVKIVCPWTSDKAALYEISVTMSSNFSTLLLSWSVSFSVFKLA